MFRSLINTTYATLHRQSHLVILVMLFMVVLALLSLAAHMPYVQAESSMAGPTPTALHSAEGHLTVVGGELAAPQEFPWMARLMTINSTDNMVTLVSFCGGTLIHPEWVVSAAHCFYDKQTGELMDRTGLHVFLGGLTYSPGDYLDYEAGRVSNGVYIPVDRVILHEDYEYHTTTLKPRDIALLHLAAPVDITSTNLATLPLLTLTQEATYAAPGQSGILSGWGLMEAPPDSGYDLTDSDALRKVTLPIRYSDQCFPFEPVAIRQSLLCTGGEGFMGGALGDSGGPFVVQTNTGPALGGVASFIQIGANKKITTTFTRVTAYTDWITQHVDLNAPVPSPTATPDQTTAPSPTVTPDQMTTPSPTTTASPTATPEPTIPLPPVALRMDVNVLDGAPGSIFRFTVTGATSADMLIAIRPPDQTSFIPLATLSMSGGIATRDFVFALYMLPNVPAGVYEVQARQNAQSISQFITIRTEADRHTDQPPDGVQVLIFPVPLDNNQQRVYLPLIQR